MRSAWLRLSAVRREHAHLLGGSVWLVVATAAVSIGSFAFWLLVARAVSADEVGRAAALYSATLFVCYLTSLGLPIAVSRYASDSTQSSAILFAWSLLLTVAASLAGTAVFAAVSPDSIREGLTGIPVGLAWLAAFLLTAGMAISLLVDVRLMALRRWSLVFWRGVLIATLRLPFLLWVPDEGTALYLYAVAAGAFGLTGVGFLVPLAHRNWLRLRPLPRRAPRAVRFAGVNYVGQLAMQAPFFVVPFIVLTHVEAVENARFYLSWGVMTVVYISVQMISQALLVEGGRDGADHRRQATVAMVVGLAVTTSASVMSLGLGPLLAHFFGPDYGPIATLLPILMIGTIPFAATMTMLTASRIREHTSSTIALSLALAVAVLLPTGLLTVGHGALGAAWGWTIGNTIAAGLALLAFRLPDRERGKRLQPGGIASSLDPISDGPRVDPRG